LEERKIIDAHLHHDNAVLQAKVNSLQWLVDGMTQSTHILRAQLKQHKRHKDNLTQQENEASKANPPQQA
jgi:hypothetical protein